MKPRDCAITASTSTAWRASMRFMAPASCLLMQPETFDLSPYRAAFDSAVMRIETLRAMVTQTCIKQDRSCFRLFALSNLSLLLMLSVHEVRTRQRTHTPYIHERTRICMAAMIWLF